MPPESVPLPVETVGTLPSSDLPLDEWAQATATAYGLSNQEVLCAAKGKDHYLLRTCIPYESLDAVRADYPDFVAPPEQLGDYKWTGIVYPDSYLGESADDYVLTRKTDKEIETGSIAPPDDSMTYGCYELVYQGQGNWIISLSVLDTENKSRFTSVGPDSDTVTLSNGDVVDLGWISYDDANKDGPYNELMYDNPETQRTILLQNWYSPAADVDLAELFVTYADELKTLTVIY